MRNRIRYMAFALIFTLGFMMSCGKSEELAVNNEVNEFVWRAMNQFYYWQSDVPELSDEIDSEKNRLSTFLNTYPDPEILFDDLLYEDDRFSWIVDDYEELEASFQGQSKSFGYEFRLVNPEGTNDVYGFVKYVVPPSDQQPFIPAYDAGLQRGDLFTAVDDIPLTVDNFYSLLIEQDSYTLTLGRVVDGNVESTDEKVSMSAIQLTENPIHMSNVLDVSGTKVGYLVYNQFINNDLYHFELNNVFEEFVNKGVSELVLDLRYNPGGSLITCKLLASLIYNNGSNNDIFGSVVYNQKVEELFKDQNLNYYFQSTLPNSNISLNRIDLNRVFILTSGSTASASELMIAGLSPYMEVILIGAKTVGKNEGSQTLYDSPRSFYLAKGTDLNTNHRYAIQPIISRLANSNGFTDYVDGFDPDYYIDEKDLIGSLKPLGDQDEHLLSTVIGIISGISRLGLVDSNSENVDLFDSQEIDSHLQTILLDLE